MRKERFSQSGDHHRIVGKAPDGLPVFGYRQHTLEQRKRYINSKTIGVAAVVASVVLVTGNSFINQKNVTVDAGLKSIGEKHTKKLKTRSQQSYDIVSDALPQIAEDLQTKSGSDNKSQSSIKSKKSDPKPSIQKLAWPIPKRYWDSNPFAFLKSHHGGRSYLGGPQDSSLDLQPAGLNSCGIPVFSMLDGVVTKSPMGGTGGNGVEITSHQYGNTIVIAYAHGIKNTHKETVKAGDQIMELGRTGNVDAQSCLTHIDISVNGKAVCPQDVFFEMGHEQEPNFQQLSKSMDPPCGRSL